MSRNLSRDYRNIKYRFCFFTIIKTRDFWEMRFFAKCDTRNFFIIDRKKTRDFQISPLILSKSSQYEEKLKYDFSTVIMQSRSRLSRHLVYPRPFLPYKSIAIVYWFTVSFSINISCTFYQRMNCFHLVGERTWSTRFLDLRTFVDGPFESVLLVSWFQVVGYLHTLPLLIGEGGTFFYLNFCSTRFFYKKLSERVRAKSFLNFRAFQG